jgi:hypothetical protein
MLPGPVYVYSCPHCRCLLRWRTLASGNTGGAKRWSDGAVRARMLPGTSDLIRCAHCHRLAWRNEFEEFDSYDSHLGFLAFLEEDDDEELKARIKEAELKKKQYAELSEFETPTPEEVIKFIEQSPLTSETEIKARVLAWRRWNDSRRDSDAHQPLQPNENENLLRIVELLEISKGPPLLLAEAYRNIGSFDKAMRILEQGQFTYDEELVVEFLRELIEHGDSQVCLISQDFSREWRMKRRLRGRSEPIPEPPPYDKSGPPVFNIASRDWWFKPLSTLINNWALIENGADGTATIYFFHDNGVTQNGSANFRFSQLKGRCAVVDSLDFEDADLAACELEFNGFKELRKNPGPWDGTMPFGTFYDARESEERIYSKGGYWEKAG